MPIACPSAVSRRRFVAALFLFTVIAPVLAGCPAEKPAETGSVSPTEGTSSPDASPTTGTKKVKAGLVTDTGGVNDRSFNQMAYEGLQKAEKDFGASIKAQESKANADYVSNLSRFAQAKYDIVFAVGFKMQDALKEVAPRFPNVKFVIIDGDAPDLPNCADRKSVV